MQAKEFGRILNKNQHMVLFTNEGEETAVTAITNKHITSLDLDAVMAVAFAERIAQDNDFVKEMMQWLRTHRPNMFREGEKK